ncbi:MAG TPA: flagellar hook-length control protein FliK [Steroidobacter sp.]|uniref:flagellar hook-length control protein FliK n=1 Tax=Steroidobacter sp. TaxID=1978227 RepID=UPI002EDB322B
MNAIAFGAALVSNEALASNAQLLLPQLPITQMPGLPAPALPVTAIQFGEQLRQSLGAEPIALVPVLAPRMTGEAVPKDLLHEQLSSDDASSDSERQMGDGLQPFPGLITFTQPVAVPLEYAQGPREASRPAPQASQPIGTVLQPQPIGAVLQPQQTGAVLQPQQIGAVFEPQQIGAVLQPQQIVPRDNTLLSVLAAIPETSALGAMTINPATLAPASKGAHTAVPGDNQASFAATQLPSITNAGLAQALVDGMTRQPGVLAPLSAQAPQPLDPQRSALQVALGDRLQMQITQRSEHAVIRLDPPSMGTIEIVIRRDASGSIQVHLRASNAEVARQLHGIGDSLRQDLVNRQNADVSVHVSDQSREQSAGQQQGQRQSQAQREAPGRALSESNDESSKAFTLAVDEERGA